MEGISSGQGWPAFSPQAACCLSGHRDLPARELPLLALALADALDALCARGVHVFLCGGARGFDLLAAEAVLALKQRAPQARLLMALPCPEQARGWPAADARRYREILSRCDASHTLFPAFFPGCFLARDRYMVDRSAFCLCYLRQMRGGTAYTVKYALQRELEIINLAK